MQNKGTMVQKAQKIQFIYALSELIKADADISPLYLLYDGENFIKCENIFHFSGKDITRKSAQWVKNLQADFGNVLKNPRCKFLVLAAHELGDEFLNHVMHKVFIAQVAKILGKENIFCIVNKNVDTDLSDRFLSSNIFKCNFWEIHTVLMCKSYNLKPKFIISNVKKDYLCSVNKLKILRLGMLMELYQRNMWKNGYVNLVAHPTYASKSFNLCFDYYKCNRLTDKASAVEILKQLPMSYDIDLQAGDNKWKEAWEDGALTPVGNCLMTRQEQQLVELFLNSYCSIVLETHDGVCQPSSYFLTEKTVRPIYWGHPFVILSHMGDLGRLKQQGYETFKDYCDEAYDQEIDWKLRIKKVCDALEQLIANKDSKISDILEYNHNHLINICHNNFDSLYNMLQR